MTRSASEVERHQPSADGRNQPSATTEISISSSAPNVNIGDDKSSKENNSTLATHAGRNQPSATAEICISSSAPMVNSNNKSSKDNNSTLATHIGRNQPTAMAIPTASAPGMPNLWLPMSTSATARAARTAAVQAKAREEHRLATTKDQVNKMLGEYTDLPFSSPDPKQNVRNAIDDFPTTQNFDWPDDLIK
jgi:hypothetical protein